MTRSAVPRPLIESYLAAVYRVFGTHGAFDLRIDQESLEIARLFKECAAHCAYNITAFNPLSEPTEAHLNATANSNLMQEFNLETAVDRSSRAVVR